jgi:hypothetical protein
VPSGEKRGMVSAPEALVSGRAVPPVFGTNHRFPANTKTMSCFPMSG